MLASLGATPDNGGFHVMQVDANQENDVDGAGQRRRRGEASVAALVLLQ